MVDTLFDIDGCIKVPEEMTIDEFVDCFFEFAEEQGWEVYCGFTPHTEEDNDI